MLSGYLMTSVGYSLTVVPVLFVSYTAILFSMSHSYHTIEFDKIIVTVMLTQQKLMTLVSMGKEANARLMLAFVDMT